MKMPSLVVLMAVASILVGCQGSAVFYHRDPARQIIVLDQSEISIIALGGDRWEAFGGKQSGWFGSDSDRQKARQLEAIEKVTGCRVVSSEFPAEKNENKLLIRAIVDCTVLSGR